MWNGRLLNHFWYLQLLSVLLLMMCITVVCWAADPGEINVCVLGSGQSDPDADGTRIVWTDDRSGNNDIWGYDTASGIAFPICQNSADQDGPSISGDIVVWRDFRNGNPDIYGYDLSTQKEFVICNNQNHQWHPVVHSDIVVWMDYRGDDFDIYGYNLSTHTEFVICDVSGDQWYPDVDSGKVVWEDWRYGNPDIYTYDPITASEIPLCTLASEQRCPKISNDEIVWQDNRNGNWDIYGYSLGIGPGERTYVLESGDQMYPEIAGNLIVWQDNRNGGYDIYAGDTSVPVIFPVCMESSNQLFPTVGDDIIAWMDTRNGNTDIIGFGVNQREMLIQMDASEPDVSGHKVVYLYNGGVYGKDMDLNSQFTVTVGQYSDQANPAIGGHIVAWEDGLPPWNYRIYGYNLNTQAQFVTIELNYVNWHPDVSNDGALIVWDNYTWIPRDNHDIWAYSTASMGAWPYVSVSDSKQEMPAISDNWVVWEDDRDGWKRIYAKSRSGTLEFPISQARSEKPAVSGDIVVWTDWRNDPGDSSNSDIYGYDMINSYEFPICTSSGVQTCPAICGHYVVWEDWRNGSGDIYGYDLSTSTEFSICLASGNQQRPEIDGRLVVWNDERRGTSDVYGRYMDYVWNDECESAMYVEQGRIYEGTTEFATGTDINNCTVNDALDIWFRFVPKMTGAYTISLLGSGFDTSLTVYEGCGGTELACNDDYGGAVQSQIDALTLNSGQDYLIRIAGYNSTWGPYRLQITGPTCVQALVGDSNDDCVIDLKDLQSFASQWLQNNIRP